MHDSSPNRITLADVLCIPIRWDNEVNEFVWTRDVGKRGRKGAVAGCIMSTDGYRIIRYNRKNYYAHRLAYVWHTGITLTRNIDHINGDRTDNRPCNLRQVSTAVNNQNKRRYKSNSTGHTGVGMSPNGKYRVRISKKGRDFYLGTFTSLDEALRARKGAEMSLGFHANHGTTLAT